MTDDQLIAELKKLRPKDKKFIAEVMEMMLTERQKDRQIMLERLKGRALVRSEGQP